METVTLNGYLCGVVRSQEVQIDELQATREEWSQSGMVCWVTNRDCLHSQLNPDV